MEAGHLPPLSFEKASGVPLLSAQVRPLEEVLAAAERAAIVHALQETGGNRTKAAVLLGVSMRTLFYKIGKHGLK